MRYYSGSPTPKVDAWLPRYSVPAVPKRKVPWHGSFVIEPPRRIEHRVQKMVLRGANLCEVLSCCRTEEDKMMASDNQGWALVEDSGVWTASINFYSFGGV